MKEITNGVYNEGREIFTVNSAPGTKVYGEQVIKKDREYRHWDPTRSKLAAAILNGLKTEINKGSKILYLGASTGTTPSHLSDIIGTNGIIYSVEFAERVFRSLLELSEKRQNIAPIMADARKPETYGWIESVDIVYVDLSQPEETEIAIRNANMFLKKGGLLLIAIKSQSIDVTKKPADVYKTESEKLKSAGFSILQLIDLEPYEEKHGFIAASL
ncbi:fibrillarin-like rRNA/tRNA 2'-O-methyltransferase [archaeon]|nr:fibrillarin-like rRNA/tRNA 2'-O-methyltransferase [archaeon]